MSLRHTWINQQPLDSPFDSFVGERGSRLDLFDAVDWLQELDHELVEAHAEHRRRLFELLGIECSFASQSFADGFLAHAEFLGERGLCLAVPCELAAEIPCDGFRLTHLSCRSFLCSLPCGNSYRT
nr:MAG TPA: hypothetical protein [Caudoviricetes sp.]